MKYNKSKKLQISNRVCYPNAHDVYKIAASIKQRLYYTMTGFKGIPLASCDEYIYLFFIIYCSYIGTLSTTGFFVSSFPSYCLSATFFSEFWEIPCCRARLLAVWLESKRRQQIHSALNPLLYHGVIKKKTRVENTQNNDQLGLFTEAPGLLFPPRVVICFNFLIKYLK